MWIGYSTDSPGSLAGRRIQYTWQPSPSYLIERVEGDRVSLQGINSPYREGRYTDSLIALRELISNRTIWLVDD